MTKERIPETQKIVYKITIDKPKDVDESILISRVWHGIEDWLSGKGFNQIFGYLKDIERIKEDDETP